MRSSVVAFPLCRQQGLVNSIAHGLRSKHGEEATQFWRETAKTSLRQMTANGVDTGPAEDEIRNLLYAVLAKIEAESMAETRAYQDQ